MAGEHTSPSFDEVYDAYSRYVYTLSLRLAGSRSEADDLFQEAFLRVFRHLGTFRGDPGSLKAWLRRLTVNQFLNMQQARQRWPALSLDADPERTESRLEDRGADPGLQLDSAALSDDLQQALARLPADQRAVLVLREVYDLNYEEIAELLGFSPGTMRVRLFRARARLRELLGARVPV